MAARSAQVRRRRGPGLLGAFLGQRLRAAARGGRARPGVRPRRPGTRSGSPRHSQDGPGRQPQTLASAHPPSRHLPTSQGPSPLPSFPHSVGVLKTSALFSPPFFYALILEGLVLSGGFKYLSKMITIHSPSPTPGLFPEHQASIAACLVDHRQAWHSSPTSPHVCQTCPCMSTIPQHHWELTHNTTQTRTGAHDTLLL